MAKLYSIFGLTQIIMTELRINDTGDEVHRTILYFQKIGYTKYIIRFNLYQTMVVPHPVFSRYFNFSNSKVRVVAYKILHRPSAGEHLLVYIESTKKSTCVIASVILTFAYTKPFDSKNMDFIVNNATCVLQIYSYR